MNPNNQLRKKRKKKKKKTKLATREPGPERFRLRG